MPEDALGLLEIRSWSAAIAALDAAQKAGDVELLQVELNDFYGAVVKFTGGVADVRAAVDAGARVVRDMRIDFVADVIPRPSRIARPAYEASREFNVLIEQDVVHIPRNSSEPTNVSEQQQRQLPYAIGMIETQGFTAVIEAIDTAVKAAAVEVIGKEKLGGGYVTVLIRGDVAAVQAAIDAGRARVEGLGKLIAAHVIPRPSAAVISLIPTPTPATARS